MTKNTDDKNDQVEQARKAQAEAVAAQEKRDQIQPTPTQDEADLAKLGALGEDGFASVAPSQGAEEKSETADKPGSYKTRAASAN